MIRQLVLYVLLGAVLLPMLSPLGTVAYFNLNRDYVARVLCENRDKPQMNCNGQCYLAKKLKASQDKQDKETTRRIQGLPMLEWFCESVTAFVFLPPLRLPAEQIFAYLIPCYPAPLARYFQPPKLG